MAKNKPETAGKNSNSGSGGSGGNLLMTGILVGMVIGVGMAAALAWLINQSPSPFDDAAHQPASSPIQQSQTQADSPAAATAEKPQEERFDFYQVLTDEKQVKPTAPPPPPRPEPGPEPDRTVTASPSASEARETSAESAPKSIDDIIARKAQQKQSSEFNPHLLQVGAFSTREDAEKRKAALAFQGLIARIETATIPDKGTWHRVRLGPYRSEAEMQRAEKILKQNGLLYTPIRAQ